ncbi:TPA: LacI family DNA-binding transcriptional regulator [Klebsiella pneumoniae subsp. ozaenae]|nr:LacI family DNA-binding transcriptional regulator [Klebsiella pneumoniae subsp. ozaenae]
MSLKAIAKQLGISVTTVSRALNGYDDVSQETRARVEAEAQRRGYRPNTFARRLKMGTIDAVGLVFPVRPAPLNNNVFLEMVGEISHELARHDIDLLLIADDEQADKHGYMRMVQGRRVDALIVAHTLDDDPRLAQLQASGFPFLALAHLGRLTGDNRVALVVYDGLPQDSIIETDVAAVIQSTRQGVGRQIADMVRRLIAGEDLATLQVLWQPEFIPGETA